MHLRPLFLLAALCLPAASLAVDPDRLRLGAYPSLGACLDGTEAACEQAAALVDDAGWAAWLRQKDTSALGDDDRRVFLALDCAAEDGASCTGLAADLMATDPLRASMLYARGCGLGDGPACDLIEASLYSTDAAYHLLAGGASWAGTTPVYARPAEADELVRLGKACAAGTWPGACFDLGGAVWRTLGDLGPREANLAALDDACAAHVEPACRLREDMSPGDEVVIPGLGPSEELLGRLCLSDGVGRACELQGNLLELGRASPFGTSASRAALQEACDNSRSQGCDRITRAYRTPLAAELMASCDTIRSGGAAPAHACVEASVMLRYGVGAAKDVPGAEQRLKDACHAGDGGACATVGDDLDDTLESLPWWDQACAQGAWAYCGGKLASRLDGSHGVPIDPLRAVKDMRTGCTHGDADSCAGLAYALEDTDGVTEDPSATFNLYLQACSLGSDFGCGGLGWALSDGYGTAPDPSAALSLLLHACGADDITACAFLGQMYQTGTGVAVDLARARAAYKLACKAGDPGSCDTLDEIGREPVAPLASMTLPALRGSGPFGGGSPTYGPPLHAPVVEEVEEERPRTLRAPSQASYRSGPTDGASLWLALGSQRSWATQIQAASVRGGLSYTRGLFGAGINLDWLSDHRWKPKVARQYFRITLNADLWLRAPTGSALDVLVGAGAGVGGYRQGPGKINPLLLSENTHEFVQFNFHVEHLLVGVRLEQTQWFQKLDGLGLEHATGIYGLIGVTGGK